MLQKHQTPPGLAYRKRAAGTNQRLNFVVFLLSALVFVSPCTTASDRSPILNLDLDAPRDFGYVIGDIIHHKISLNIIKPYTLETNYLPQKGSFNRGLEIRQIRVHEQAAEQSTEYRIDIDYLILKGSQEPERVFVPELRMRLYDGEHSVPAMIPKWGFSYAPLIPPQTKDKNVLIRPAIEPPMISATIHHWILSIIAGAVTLLMAIIAWQQKMLPFFDSGGGPFKQACRNLKRRRGAKPLSAAYRHALQDVHKALNATAGRTVFADYLREFFDYNPHFNPLREPTEIFFKISRQAFFEQPQHLDLKNYPISWLESLCRRYRKIERNS